MRKGFPLLIRGPALQMQDKVGLFCNAMQALGAVSLPVDSVSTKQRIIGICAGTCPAADACTGKQCKRPKVSQMDP